MASTDVESAKPRGAKGGGAPGWGLVLIRVYLGWMLLQAGYAKVTAGVGAELVEGTRATIAAAPGWYRAFAENVVLELPSLFAFLIQWGELVGGACLFLGLCVRPVGLAVALMMANFYFAGPRDQQPLVLLTGLCAVALSISMAGRKLGFDGLLGLPRWMSWSKG